MKNTILYIAVICLLSSFTGSETIWKQDKMHSQLNFSATHFGISTIDGRFQNFTITMKSEKQDFSDAQIEMTAAVRSINTEVEYRDNDLRGAGWFDADKYPTLTFKSSSFTKTADKTYQLKGDLTMHGITKAVVFDATVNGWAVTMTKKNTAGFTIRGTINRSDYKIGNAEALTGVSDEIEVWTNVEMGKN